jgi:hypothetical protein
MMIYFYAFILTICMTFNDLRATFVGQYSVSSLGFSVDEDDLTILGILVSVDVEDFLE